MIKVFYDSKSEAYKKPFGAVATEQRARFCLYIIRDNEIFYDVNFIYRKDASDKSVYVPMSISNERDDLMVFSAEVTFNSPGLYFYRFEIETASGTKFIGLKNGAAAIEDWLPEWQLTVYDKSFKTPDWAKGSIMYQIFPDRFAKSESFSPLPARNVRKIHDDWYSTPEFIYDTPDYKANDYFCGNINGIIEKIDYLKTLGVNIIYLNPIFESPEYHRYSTADYMKVDPYFGTNELFSLLCKRCRDAGIRIILDGVFSHTGADSIYFNKYSHYESLGAYNSQASPYYSWYTFSEYPEKYESWWGFKNLPNVNETNPEYLEYITGENGVIKYWQSLGASGWRLDVADELPDEFLDRLYQASKNKNDDSFIIGEVWEDATNKIAYGKRRRYLLGGQMDSVMNYPWRTAILEFVKYGDEKLFNDRLLSVMENYPPEVLQCLMNSISTHDTLRAITYFGVEHEVADRDKGRYLMTHNEYLKGREMLLYATFLQFTLPGIPCIYYGDEVGLSGFRDPYCRKTYPYGKEDLVILEFYKKLSRIRTEHKASFTSIFKFFDMKDGLYAFFRGELLCAINLGKNKKYIKVQNKKAVFQHGKAALFDHGADLFPGAMIILMIILQ